MTEVHSKDYFEEELHKLTKKVLNKKILMENKDKNLVNHNFFKKFLMDLPKEGNVVLSMGINPGGGNEIVKIKKETHESIYFLANLSDEEIRELKIFNNVYVFTKNYHKSNYELFDCINAKAHWAMDGYLNDEELKKMIYNSSIKKPNTKYNTDRIIELIRKMQDIERKKCNKNTFVLFSNLLFYADGNQKNIERSINIKNLNENIKEIIKLNIEYYKPKLIVITNAKASHLVADALKDNITKNKDVIIFNGVPIILASMVSGRRPMDTYSKIRLKDRILEFYVE